MLVSKSHYWNKFYIMHFSDKTKIDTKINNFFIWKVSSHKGAGLKIKIVLLYVYFNASMCV